MRTAVVETVASPYGACLADFFWARVTKAEGDGCWLYPAGKSKPGSYITVYLLGYYIQAHRLAWRILNGPIPDGLCVLHTCDNTHCVRPDHLFLGTRKDNVNDMMRKGRAQWSRQRTHCFRGHELTAENIVILRSGARTCRICREHKQRLSNEKRYKNHRGPNTKRVLIPAGF